MPLERTLGTRTFLPATFTSACWSLERSDCIVFWTKMVSEPQTSISGMFNSYLDTVEKNVKGSDDGSAKQSSVIPTPVEALSTTLLFMSSTSRYSTAKLSMSKVEFQHVRTSRGIIRGSSCRSLRTSHHFGRTMVEEFLIPNADLRS